nr:uncharacterized protein c11e3.10 [Quercus suber]
MDGVLLALLVFRPACAEPLRICIGTSCISSHTGGTSNDPVEAIGDAVVDGGWWETRAHRPRVTLHVNSDNVPSTEERPNESARRVPKGAIMGLVRIVVAARVRCECLFDGSKVCETREDGGRCPSLRLRSVEDGNASAQYGGLYVTIGCFDKMPALRIRHPFAAAFGVLLLASAYLGLSTQKIPQYGQSDKGLHFITFFLLTATFYWIFEIPRRRLIHLTLIICTAGLAIASEIVQAALPNDRLFDPYDIAANVLGSGLALGACSWYHKRMLERKRKNKHYDIVPGDEGDLGDDPERDVELGRVGVAGQETGVIHDAHARPEAVTDVTEELDNWDENEEDWDAETPRGEDQQKTPGTAAAEGSETKKRAD